MGCRASEESMKMNEFSFNGVELWEAHPREI
jgi:hypothetical protein